MADESTELSGLWKQVFDKYGTLQNLQDHSLTTGDPTDVKLVNRLIDAGSRAINAGKIMSPQKGPENTNAAQTSPTAQQNPLNPNGVGVIPPGPPPAPPVMPPADITAPMQGMPALPAPAMGPALMPPALPPAPTVVINNTPAPAIPQALSYEEAAKKYAPAKAIYDTQMAPEQDAAEPHIFNKNLAPNALVPGTPEYADARAKFDAAAQSPSVNGGASAEIPADLGTLHQYLFGNKASTPTTADPNETGEKLKAYLAKGMYNIFSNREAPEAGWGALGKTLVGGQYEKDFINRVNETNPADKAKLIALVDEFAPDDADAQQLKRKLQVEADTQSVTGNKFADQGLDLRGKMGPTPQPPTLQTTGLTLGHKAPAPPVADEPARDEAGTGFPADDPRSQLIDMGDVEKRAEEIRKRPAPEVGNDVRNGFLATYSRPDGGFDFKKAMEDARLAFPPPDYKKLQEHIAALGAQPNPTIWNVIAAFFAGLSRSPEAMRLANNWYDRSVQWTADRNKILENFYGKADAQSAQAVSMVGQAMHAYVSANALAAQMEKFSRGQEGMDRRQANSIGAQNDRTVLAQEQANARAVLSQNGMNDRQANELAYKYVGLSEKDAIAQAKLDLQNKTATPWQLKALFGAAGLGLAAARVFTIGGAINGAVDTAENIIKKIDNIKFTPDGRGGHSWQGTLD